MEEKYKITRTRKKLIVTEITEDIELSLNEFIGYNISELRKQHNITQIDLAKKLKLNRASITNIEAGRQPVNINKLKIICNLFKCSAFDILKF